VSWDEVAHEDKNGHNDMLSDGHHVGTSDLGDGDAAVGLVCCIKIDMVGTNSSCDSDLEVLRLG
jgi:hypothetical protein